MITKWNRAMSAVVGMSFALAACGPAPEAPAPKGEARVAVRGLGIYNIYSLVITAQPANVSKTLFADGNSRIFAGTLLLPAGEQALTVKAFNQDPDAGAVAIGTGKVLIEPDNTAAVTVLLFDLRPMAAQPDIGPIIRFVGASKAKLVVNEPTTVSADAVDLDEDPLSYAWTSDCASGSFADPTAATTTWTSSTPALCNLTVAVSSRSERRTESVSVTVSSAPAPGEGMAEVTSDYIPRPLVAALSLSGPDFPTVQVPRRSPQGPVPPANFPPVRVNTPYLIDMLVGFGTTTGTFQTGLQIDCGGRLEKLSGDCSHGFNCMVQYRWTPPAAGTVCRLTGTAANGPLTDQFSAGVLVR